MSSYTQLILGLRSLALKIAVFVVLAGIFAWFLGGSIFPGSQVVNWPSFPWQDTQWHLQVTGNGNRPAPIRWRLYRQSADGGDALQTLGILGVWRQVHGPLMQADRVTFAIESDNDGTTTWWVAQIDSAGVVTQHEVRDERTMIGELYGEMDGEMHGIDSPIIPKTQVNEAATLP